MRWVLWTSLVMSAGFVGCGLSSSGDDLINPANSGIGVDAGTGGTDAGTSGAAGVAGTGPGGSAGSGGGAAGSGGSGGAAGTGGAGKGGSAGSAGGSAGSGGTGIGGTGASDAGPDVASPEDCTNGEDDNGDGLLDCADAWCVPDHVCVPTAPNGWSEPGYVAQRATAQQASDCESMLPFSKVLHDELQGAPAQCSCVCDEPVGGTCDGSGILWQFPACAGGTASSDGACHSIPSSWTIGSVFAYEGTVTAAGTCVSSVSTTIPPVQWGVSADLCLPEALGAGCGPDHVCIPRPPQGADDHACIASTGEKGCPGAFPTKRLYFESYDDSRTCTDGTCSCNAAAGQECPGEYQLFSDNTCTNVVFSAPLDGACHNADFGQDEVHSDRIVVGAPTGGSCNPQGNGTAVGSVAASLAHTVCCTSQSVP